MNGGSLHCTGGSDQDYPQEKEMPKGKMVVWGGLKNTGKRREVKDKGEKERYTHLNAEFQTIARRNKKVFLSDQWKEIPKSKMVIWGGLTNSCERREAKSKWEKERYTHLSAEFQRIARTVKKAYLSDKCKEIEENNRMGKARNLREGNGTPLQYSCLENPMDGGTW